jgi:hypothetical protein
MNVLEHEMSEVAEWIAGDTEQALGDHRERMLGAWMTKTHVLLCYIEGDAARFGDSGFDRAVVPPVSLARALFEQRYEDLAELGLGLARSESDTDFAYEFGTPGTVKVQGREQGAYTAPTSIITLGRLQVWAISPLIVFSPTVAFPPFFRAAVSCGRRVCGVAVAAFGLARVGPAEPAGVEACGEQVEPGCRDQI